jgi:hypothetical protein
MSRRKDPSSSASDDFREARKLSSGPDSEAAGRLYEIAGRKYARRGKFLLAALATQKAAIFARNWRSRASLEHRYLRLLRHTAEDSAAPEAERLVAGWKLGNALWRVPEHQNQSRMTVARRLTTLKKHPHILENLNVIGVVLCLDLESEEWQLWCPEGDIRFNGEWGSGAGRDWCVPIPSVFQVNAWFRGDFAQAKAIGDDFPTAFCTDNLRGWRCAVNGFCAQDGRAALFFEAAEIFGRDSPKSRFAVAGWDSENTHVWSPYFRSRSSLACAVERPKAATDLVIAALSQADSLDNIPWMRPHVGAYFASLQVLGRMLGLEGYDLERARRALWRSGAIGSEDDSSVSARRTLGLAEEVMNLLETDPAVALGRGDIARLLERIDLMPLEAGLARSVGEIVYRASYWGPKKRWIYEALLSIETETQLRAVMLQLVQATGPKVAQVLHGSLEYGTDLVWVDAHDTLRTLQLKRGNLEKRHGTEIRRQVEEMFLVTPLSVNIPTPVKRRSAIVAFNGHVAPPAVLPFRGWLADLQRQGKDVELWDVDVIARWIVDNGLEATLRRAMG